MKALIFFILMASLSVLLSANQTEFSSPEANHSEEGSATKKAKIRSWKGNWMGP